jgi:hypothetical protein
MSMLDPTLAARLAAIRGSAPRRSPGVRVLAAFAQNTACRLANLGFAARVDFDQLLKGTRFQAPFGQSPFAFQRGLAFERMLQETNYTRTRGLLSEPLGVPPAEMRVINLREGIPAAGNRLPARADATMGLIHAIIHGESTAPHLIDGAVLRGSVGGLEEFFEADGLAARAADGEIRVVELKSFPKIDDRIAADQLGAALDQTAVYLMLTLDAVAGLGGDPTTLVSDRVILITPRNVGLSPTYSEQRLSGRLMRMRRVFAAVPNVADVAAATPTGISFGSVADRHAEEAARLDRLHDIADQVGTVYSENCLTTCGNARFCRARAIAAGSPCVAGLAAQRSLPQIVSLGRAESLTRGAAPTAAEAPIAALLERAGRLIDDAGLAAVD